MFCKTLFLWKISGFNTCVWTASVWITRKTLMAEFYEHEKGGGQLAVMSEWPFPRPSRRLGPLQTETSQMKLRRASGAGSTHSSSRLSCLWLLVRPDTPPCLCETSLFLQPPKGVQWWLNTPWWPYPLSYYYKEEGHPVFEYTGFSIFWDISTALYTNGHRIKCSFFSHYFFHWGNPRPQDNPACPGSARGILLNHEKPPQGKRSWLLSVRRCSSNSVRDRLCPKEVGGGGGAERVAGRWMALKVLRNILKL